MILRFGKYRGWRVDEVPMAYLAWLFENLDGKPELQEAARQEIQRRVSGYGEDADHLDAGRIQRVYRTLAMEFHPDRTGGNGEVMKGINAFYEAICK